MIKVIELQVSFPLGDVEPKFFKTFITGAINELKAKYLYSPTNISIPIFLLPQWRQFIEDQRIGPWHEVYKFDGMDVSYNTVQPPTLILGMGKETVDILPEEGLWERSRLKDGN